MRDRYWARVTVNSPHVGAKQWNAIRRRLRHYVGITKQKPFTRKDKQLLDAIDRLWGVPGERGAMGHFWRSVLQECGAEFRTWKSPVTPRLQYRRIKEKLETLASLEPKDQEDKRKTRDLLNKLRDWQSDS